MRKYSTTAAFEAALSAHLRSRVEPRRTLQTLRKQIAFDRILARLVTAAPNAWLLKGGVALEYRTARARATIDIDLSTRETCDDAFAAISRAEDVRMDDYFAIRIGERSRPVAEIEIHRVSVSVLFENGRLFEPLKLDIGFCDPWITPAESLSAPSLLAFAGIAPARINAIPLGQHFAEKIHAYTKTYGAGGSSRVKDLVDMRLMIDEPQYDAGALPAIIREVFEARATHAIPPTFPAPPTEWAKPYRRLAELLDIEDDIDTAYARVAERLDPTLDEIRRGIR